MDDDKTVDKVAKEALIGERGKTGKWSGLINIKR